MVMRCLHRGQSTRLVAITIAHDARSRFHALEDRGSPRSAMLPILAPGPGEIRRKRAILRYVTPGRDGGRYATRP